MKKPSIKTVAVVGTGVIGRCWIPVFARAGCRVRVHDASPEQLTRALDWFRADLKDLRRRGMLKKKEVRARLERVVACERLEEAVAGAGYIQESLPEVLEIKHAALLEIDQLAAPNAIIGSSTSAIDMSEIAKGIPGAWRCIVAHPCNPPHMIPGVEVLRGAETDPQVERRTLKFLREIGQTPILMHRFVTGFVINRMQAALIREAVDLVASGVADVDAVDAAIRDGIGLRWAFMGPFAVANTNADGGVREYFTRYRDAYHSMWDVLNTGTRFNDDLVEQLGKATDAMMGSTVDAQRAWRDRMLGAIQEAKRLIVLEKSQGKRENGTGKQKKKAKTTRRAAKRGLAAANAAR